MKFGRSKETVEGRRPCVKLHNTMAVRNELSVLAVSSMKGHKCLAVRNRKKFPIHTHTHTHTHTSIPCVNASMYVLTLTEEITIELGSSLR